MNNIIYDGEAEEAVLGSLLLDTAISGEVIGIIGEDTNAFYVGANRAIYSAMLELLASNNPTDALSVGAKIRDKGLLNYVGGAEKIKELVEETYRIKDCTPCADNASYYAQIVKEKFVRRNLQIAARNVYNFATDETKEIEEVVSSSSDTIFGAISENGHHREINIETALARLDFEWQERMAGRPVEHSIFTGFPSLDEISGGLHFGEVSVIAGRTSSGKSILGQCISLYVAAKMPVIIFSPEMTQPQILLRMLSILSSVPCSKIARQRLAEEEYQTLTFQRNELAKMPIKIVDRAIKTSTMIVETQRFMSEKKTDKVLVVIDYLQKVPFANDKDSLYEGTSKNMTSISNNLAMNLKLPVLLISQVNRRSEQTGRVSLADLRQCISGDARILTDKGSWIKVKNLSLNNRIATMDSEFKIRWTNPLAIISKGEEQVYEVITSSGISIKSTGEHPYLTIDGWKSLKSLSVGDEIAILRNIAHPNCELHNPNLGKFMGYLIGDGSYLRHRTVSFTNSDLAMIEEIKKIASEEFPGISFTEKLKFKSTNIDFVATPILDLFGNKFGYPGGNSIINWLKKIDAFDNKDYAKRIPNIFMSADDETVLNLIAGLIMTDGSIVKYKHEYLVKYSSVSLGLLRDFQLLLTRFSIVSMIDNGYKSKKATMPIHNLRIVGKYALELLLRIRHFMVGRKFNKAIEAIDFLSAKTAHSNNSLDLLPLSITEQIKSIKERRNLSWSQLGYRCQKGRRISREYLALVAEKLDNELFRDLSNSDLSWDKIAAINETGIETVYDLQVPDTHCFVCDGVIIHNSGIIEQDAALVFIIHSFDGELLGMKNISEIEIAKNRLGSTGTANLRLIKECTKFEST